MSRRVTSRPGNRALIACAIAAFAAFGAGAGAASPGAAGPRLEVSLGFDGYVAPRRWAPLWIESGVQADGARIEVVRAGEDGAELSREIFAYRPGRRIECPVMVDESAPRLIVRLVSGSEVLAEARLATRAKIFPGHIALVCADGAAIERAVASALLPSEPIQAVSVEPGELPAVGLDWDGVGALVVDGGAEALSPAQRSAVGAWIAAGGSMVVTNVRAPEEGLAASILGPEAPWEEGETPGSRVYRAGLGRIAELGESRPGDRPPADAVKAALDLEPYGARASAVPGRVLPAADGTWAKAPDAAAAERAITISLIAWAIAAAAMAFGKTRRVLPLAVFTVCALAAAVAGGTSADRARHRGVATYAHALVLPGKAGAYVRVGMQAPRIDERRDWTSIAAGRSVGASYGREERGSLDPGGASLPAWSHEGGAVFSIRSSAAFSLTLDAALGPEAIAGSSAAAVAAFADGAAASAADAPPGLPPISSGKVAYVGPGAAGRWWSLAENGRWTETKPFPAWLEGDAAWIFRVKEALPRLGFVVGKESLPGFGFAVHGARIAEVAWALPLAAPTPGEEG